MPGSRYGNRRMGIWPVGRAAGLRRQTWLTPENNRDLFGGLIYDRVLASSPGTLPTPPCPTSTVHTGRHNITLKNTTHHTMPSARCAGALTPYGAPDCRRRYAERTGNAPLADSASYHIGDRGLLLLEQPAGSARFLPSAFAFSKPALARRRMDTSSWVGHPGGEAGQGIAQDRLRRLRVGIQVLDPRLFVVGQAANPHPAPLQVVDVAHGVPPAPPVAVDGHHDQGVALSQPGVQRVPAPPAVSTGGSGNAGVLKDVRKRHADSQQLLALGFPGRCPTARRLWAGWCGRSRRSRASLPLRLVRIALYLCDPHLNKLKGVDCGPVSQTRVCDPPNQRGLNHMDHSGTVEQLVRNPSYSDVTDSAGCQESVRELPPARSTLASPPTALIAVDHKVIEKL